MGGSGLARCCFGRSRWPIPAGLSRLQLVMPGEVAPADMKPGAIYNSNRFFLRALLQRLTRRVVARVQSRRAPLQ